MNNQRLILYEKIYEMSLYGYQRISSYDRNYRDTLGKSIKDCMNSMLNNASRLEKKYNKKNTIQDIDIENDCLKKFIRMSKDLKMISMGQYEHWAKMCVEIGKIVGGMINANSEAEPGKENIYVCSSCNSKIAKNVYGYSLEHFKKPLCLRCQKIERERIR